MRLGSGSDATVAAGGTFTVTIRCDGGGFLHGLALQADVASNLETLVSSIKVGGKEFLPNRAGGAIPWSALITRNGTQWLDVVRAVAIKGSSDVVVTGTNGNAAASTFYGAALYGKEA